MSRLGKRAIPLLLLSILLFSLIPAMTVNAVSVTSATPNHGGYGDTIVVVGTGVTAGMVVNLYWDSVKAWDGTKGLMNSTEAEASGDFEVWFDVPAAVWGTHYIWVKDTDTGETASLSFTVDPMLKLTPSSGLQGDKVTIKGYGFDDEVDIDRAIWNYGGYLPMKLTLTPLTPETTTLGSWEATFKVPSNYTYATYPVRAIDKTGYYASKNFILGAAITFDVSEGPTGEVLEIRGRGYDPDESISAGEVTLLDGVTTIDLYIYDAPVDVESDGEFALDVVIPQVSTKKEEYDITVTDGVESATEAFNVTALAKITVDPEYGVQGYRVNIEGVNFVNAAGEDVALELWDAYPSGAKQSDIKELETESDGTFSGTFTVPAVSSGNYEVVAIQSGFEIADDTAFRVGMIIVILSKTSGPCGSKITMTGTGFTPDETWNATFGDLVLIEEGDVQTDGDLELDGKVPYFFVPTVDPGTYTIMVLDIDTEIEVEVEFEVTDKTEAWTDPLVAPNEYNVTIEGQYFTEEAGVDVTFVLYNVTAAGKVDEDWDITADVHNVATPAVRTNEDGEFIGYWFVDEDDVLSIGDYIMNVTDENDLFAQLEFSVVSKTVEIEPRKATFRIGETVGFKVESSFAQEDSYIKVWTPDDELYWTSDIFYKAIWIKVGTVMRVPYYEQTAGGNPMLLLEDAPLGTWTWTWYDDEDEEIDSGTFVVQPAAEEVLGEQLSTLQGTVTQLTTNFNSLQGTVGTLSTSVTNMAAQVASAAQAANSANQAVTNLSQTVSEIAQTANSAKTAADAAKTAAESAKSSADEAKTAASGLTTLVYGAIGASLVAALAAIVSLMQISRRIAG
jgi:hypothetical protein